MQETAVGNGKKESRISNKAAISSSAVGKIKCQQHAVFPGGHPPKYWPRPMLLNCGDRTRTGAFSMVWPLTEVGCKRGYLRYATTFRWHQFSVKKFQFFCFIVSSESSHFQVSKTVFILFLWRIEMKLQSFKWCFLAVNALKPNLYLPFSQNAFFLQIPIFQTWYLNFYSRYLHNIWYNYCLCCFLGSEVRT